MDDQLALKNGVSRQRIFSVRCRAGVLDLLRGLWSYQISSKAERSHYCTRGHSLRSPPQSFVTHNRCWALFHSFQTSEGLQTVILFPANGNAIPDKHRECTVLIFIALYLMIFCIMSVRVNALHGHSVLIRLVYVVIYSSHLPSADVTGVKRSNSL